MHGLAQWTRIHLRNATAATVKSLQPSDKIEVPLMHDTAIRCLLATHREASAIAYGFMQQHQLRAYRLAEQQQGMQRLRLHSVRDSATRRDRASTRRT